MVKKNKKDNIAEYILYLWQIEDYLRAFPQQADATPELQEFNQMMHREGIIDGGHLQLAKNALNELEELHTRFLNEDAMYRAAIIRLQPSLNLLKAKTDRPTMSDIEACRASRSCTKSCCYIFRKKRFLPKRHPFSNKPQAFYSSSAALTIIATIGTKPALLALRLARLAYIPAMQQ